MSSAETAPRRRRRHAPSKGDLREKAVLDAAEELLEVETFDGITVEAIARGAGIARNALYFYFASKQEVITALVRRTVAEISEDATSVAADAQLAPREAVVRAVRNTEHSWAARGRLMSVAVELGAVIPEIGARGHGARGSGDGRQASTWTPPVGTAQLRDQRARV